MATKLPAGLWDHQRRAVRRIEAYLATPQTDGTAALITMPTGTGKTGVIATTVTALPVVSGHRLVLTPWTALSSQLITDLSYRFWRNIPEASRPKPLPVRRLPPSTKLPNALAGEPTVYVATIAAISVASNRAETGEYRLDEVFHNFGCVIVDEGHYEPAAEWSQAIRSLQRPTILLTATPYRNDEKYFEVDAKWRYRYPHWKAEDDGFLRKPEFVTLDARDPDTFVVQLLEQLHERFGGDDSVRAIVRCDDHDSIRMVVTALENAGQSVIGLHERFPAGDGVLRKTVPPATSNFRFWVHQYKLIEGIDDPRFKALAFYDALRNGRAIVQQIGRVLRNPTRDSQDTVAAVIDRGERDIERTWNNYRAFDRQRETESIATAPKLVEKILAVQPDAFYYDGGYRAKVDLTNPQAWQEFAFSLRTRVYRRVRNSTVTIDEVTVQTAAEWGDRDRSVFTTQEPSGRPTKIIPYVSAENSPLLLSGIFIEPEFGYTVIRLVDDLLFFYDSRGGTPNLVEEHFRPLRPAELQKLFPRGVSTITSVSLVNTDIGRQAARGRQLRASAIDDLAPDLADYAYACTIAEGATEIHGMPVRRYLGLSRSRITDYRPVERDYATYSAWLDGLLDELRTQVQATTTFTRYATEVDPPANKDPLHILLDIDPARFVRAGDHAPLVIEDRAVEVVNHRFELSVDGNVAAAFVGWDEERERYEMASVALERYFTDESEPRDLVASVNSEQAFRIVPTERTTIYTGGSFYKPVIPATAAGAFRLLDILTDTPDLAHAGSEKGAAIQANDWDPASVFGMISALSPTSGRDAPESMRAVLSNPDFLLCTDLGTEVADFVATQGTRVVFIHAKASDTPHYYSASALHDVTSQAVKNLQHLQPLIEIPLATAAWTQDWSAPPHVQGATARLRVGNFATGDEMWTHIRNVIAAPDSQREVWLVLGQSLSKGELLHQAENPPAAAEAIQVFSLLQTTWGAVSQLGARLRIFCSP